MKVTPEIIQRVKEIKEDYPNISYREIARLVGVISWATVGRILKDEYRVKDGKVIRVKKVSAGPGQIAMLKQFRKVLEVTIHETAEMSRENKVIKHALNDLKNDLLETDMELEHHVEEAEMDELDALEGKFNSIGFFHLADEVCREKKRRKVLKFIKEGGLK